MELSKQEWKQILSPVEDSEIQEVIDDTSARLWQDPQETRRGRLENNGALNEINRWLSDYEEPGVLEIGCSTGFTTEEIAGANTDADVHGIDIYNGFRHSGNYVQASGLELPFSENSQELVVAPNSVGLVTWKGIATRTGGRQSKRTDTYNELWDELDVNGKSELSSNAAFKGGAAYKELFVEKILEEAGRVLNPGGRFALMDGENYMVARKGNGGWTLEGVKADDSDRYDPWEDAVAGLKAGYTASGSLAETD
jgi:SAM-dependent methyltransferase